MKVSESFEYHDMMITLGEMAWLIAKEDNPEERKFLYELFEDQRSLVKYMVEQAGKQEEEFTGFLDFNFLLDRDMMCLNSLYHFKEVMLRRHVTKEKWEAKVKEYSEGMEEELVKKYIEGYDKFIKRREEYWQKWSQ